MTQPLTTVEKIRRLPWNVALNAFNNIFAQLTFFGSAFVLFLNELGTNNTQIGFLLSLLPFLASSRYSLPRQPRVSAINAPL